MCAHPDSSASMRIRHLAQSPHLRLHARALAHPKIGGSHRCMSSTNLGSRCRNRSCRTRGNDAVRRGARNMKYVPIVHMGAEAVIVSSLRYPPVSVSGVGPASIGYPAAAHPPFRLPALSLLCIFCLAEKGSQVRLISLHTPARLHIPSCKVVGQQSTCAHLTCPRKGNSHHDDRLITIDPHNRT